MKRASDRAGSGKLGVLAAALGMLVPAVWLYTTITPGEDMVRLRNAIGAEVGQLADFDWAPSDPPASFLLNEGAVPESFERLAAGLDPDDAGQPGREFDLALSISRDLMKAPNRVGGPIRADSAATYEAITERGRGYCADFTKVFNAIALGAKVPVRQWGFAFSGFGSGHTFNEVYDNSRGKWLMVDSFHSLYFVDPVSREPLSVIELHDRLLRIGGEDRGVGTQRIVPERFPFRSEELAIDYYRRGMSQLWLVWGNNVFDFEGSALISGVSGLNRALGQLTGVALGEYPVIRIYPKGLSERDLAELKEGRDEFLLAAGALLVSVLVFGGQIVGFCRARRVHNRRVTGTSHGSR